MGTIRNNLKTLIKNLCDFKEGGRCHPLILAILNILQKCKSNVILNEWEWYELILRENYILQLLSHKPK